MKMTCSKTLMTAQSKNVLDCCDSQCPVFFPRLRIASIRLHGTLDLPRDTSAMTALCALVYTKRRWLLSSRHSR